MVVVIAIEDIAQRFAPAAAIDLREPSLSLIHGTSASHCPD